ncbi:nitrite reductase [Apiospora phragmitis]|uniref:Nitrite reductase n=1 Tax=Apiospora phragmitis TaxID=2905665 RepID=A0ABR1VID6_9PEZI
MVVDPRKKLVVVGLGMVGIAFIEKVLKLDARHREYDIVVIGEEPHLAYNRVGLTSFFDHRKVENLYLNPQDWYSKHAPENQLGYHVNTLVTSIDADGKTVTCQNGDVVSYDTLVLATGSDAILPRQTPGHDANGVFVYRTIDDLERLIAFGESKKETVGMVVGGGLLGLEAAKAMMDLECFSKVKLIERNRWVLSRQLDADAGGLVIEKVTELGVDILLRRRVAKIKTDEGNNVIGVAFEDGEEMDCSTICFAIGVRPRDSLARTAGINCAERGGGFIVDDDLSTNVPDVYAIGECASWHNQTFGLIAPGVEMADVLSFNLTQAKLHMPRVFKRPDLSTKLKLLGVDVASFGDFFADRDGPSYLPARAARRKSAAQGADKSATNGTPQPPVKALTYKDPFQHIYKKYLFTEDGKYLLGGMMIGDTSDYIKLVPIVKNQKELEVPPGQLILGAKKDGEDDGADLEDDTQICSCHNVTKGDVVSNVKEGTCKTLGEIKACTKAGTGCGGCMPLVTTIFNKTMKDMGNEVTNYVCAHFSYSRADLYNIVMVKSLKTFPEVMREAGNDKTSDGCEACKPTVGSIFASLWNRHVMDKPTHGLQETNDRFLGNIQRNGTYSVVPRVSAGEITPEKLIAIGEVAKEYNLYTKITGGQRIDMFGAKKQDLIFIWAKLIDAGMESGHAYAKSLRTVKSCVGTTWCRYGIGDSVGMAVRLEERYKSIRPPQNQGWCQRLRAQRRRQAQTLGTLGQGRAADGGDSHPRPLPHVLHPHGRQAAAHRPLARAAPGGIKYLKEVILEDKLGLCASLEEQMRELVDTFFDEWAEAIRNPAIAAKFKQFANTDDTADNMEVEKDREQTRPVMWAKEPAREDFKGLRSRWSQTTWQPVIEASYFAGADETPNGISATIKRGDTQLALFRVRGRYYATQQMCPHKRAFALSDGLIGQEVNKAAATTPIGDGDAAATTTTSEKGALWRRQSPLGLVPLPQAQLRPHVGLVQQRRQDVHRHLRRRGARRRRWRRPPQVYIKLPPVDELDRELGTARWMVKKGEAGASQFDALDKKIQFKGHRAKKPGVRPLADDGPGAKMMRKKPIQIMAGGGGCGAAPDW